MFSLPAPNASTVHLTKRAKSFLAHLAAGRPTLEAYALAGYRGEPHAAYTLKVVLRHKLGDELMKQGWGRDELNVQVHALSELPLDPTVKAVSVKQKIDILKLYDKMLPKPLADRPAITPLKLSFNFDSKPLITSSACTDVIAGEIVEPAKAEPPSTHKEI